MAGIQDSTPQDRAQGHSVELMNTGASEEVIRSKHAALIGTPLLLIGVILAAANFRPAVTSMSSILGEVRTDLGASSLWASVLTALPTVCFGIAAVAGPWLGRRLGMARAVATALTVLTFGLILRVLDGEAVVLAGTFIAAGGIAIGNVLIPVVVKESFPNRVGLATGLYTAALNTGAALASALTPPLNRGLGDWRLAVGAWALLGVAALIIWGLGARHGHAKRTVAAAEPGTRKTSLLRSPLAWAITGFFGTQSLVAYVAMGWITELFVSYGVPRDEAGLMLAVLSVLGVPLSLIIAPIAIRSKTQSGWIAGMIVVAMLGFLGLLFAPTAAPWLWAVLIGAGMGVFSLALGVVALRAKDSHDATRLSAMAQGFGYVVAASGPLLFGLLHGATGTWTVSLIVVLAVLCVELVLGVIAGRARYV
ncbi:CynX/NimT family MFS transporter [Sciscionella sediminilitoris]|uniref:CynX/NimT family MFS transporter n=1 Tax=Sciscionella sediminilitoris TaxID=1445613 RepID=UPI0005671283|nr:MFS transporter [Sciscionella sp. SE31]